MSQPLWKPKHPEHTQMWQFMQFVAETYHQTFHHDYQNLYHWSIQHPAYFWQALTEFFHITFASPAHTILTNPDDMLQARWFQGATLNFAEKLLSRRDTHPALICIQEQGPRRVITYAELYKEVAAVAAGLQAQGVEVGDRVAGVMPNIYQTVVAMLATTAIGAIWCCCSPDFGEQALLDRLRPIAPKIIFAVDEQSYQGKTFEILSKIRAVAAALPSVQHTVIVLQGHHSTQSIPNALDWHSFKQHDIALTFTHLPFDHPVYILFSSGTTGPPKCIVHGAGGTLLQHIKELALHSDLQSTDNLCFYTTCGWMMWNWMVSGLALGATLTLYDGSPVYPNASRMFRLIDEEHINIFGTSAKFIASVEQAGCTPKQQHTLSSLRCILSTGSPLLPSHYEYIYHAVKADLQLSSISGGTDIISCFALGNPMLPVYPGEIQCIGLGLRVAIYQEHGHAVEHQRGELVCTQAFPAMPVGFWHDPGNHRYHKTYFARFPGVWTHGDFAEITPHHGVIIYGRSDATLNPGGVRIGTAEIYRQVAKVPEVLESIVIGQPFANDVRVVLFVKLQDKVKLDAALIHVIKRFIRHNASPRHVPAKIIQVHDIPRTLNGKIVELAVKQAVMGEDIANIGSLSNPESLNEYRNREELRE